MVYITADGTVRADNKEIRNERQKPLKTVLVMDNNDRNSFQKLKDRLLGLELHWKVVLLACFAFAFRQWLRPNPLANGKIPAAALAPDQHFHRIAKDDMFVRVMTANLGAPTHWKGKTDLKKKLVDSTKLDETTDKIDIMLDKVDFGGPDGHVPEGGDWSDLKYVQTTRCSTTRSAVTAYFCGAQVAENQDFALGTNRKAHNSGVDSFANFLACRHQQGESKEEEDEGASLGGHRRSVYRIGIASRAPLSRYSHAFNIIAQPDGSFYWLQAYIGHYSLSQWMLTTTSSSNDHVHHQAHLSFDELMVKLAQVKRLMNITGWTAQANQDYYELFGVDKEEEAMRRGESPVHTTWKPSHRLDQFYWDEACEYPLPLDENNSDSRNNVENQHQHQMSSQVQGKQSSKQQFDLNDKCVYESIMEQLKSLPSSM